ncbi:MAG: hypothetical protein OXT09_37310 [Myxococcales bacterium]|nr:hypothetical protein [Myxococcales bacterium]
MPLGFESEVERRAIAGALQELFSGRDPQRNAAYERAASHIFQQAECKRVTRSTEGRWRSADGRWVLGATNEGLAFRARNWGPQVALLLAELNEVSPSLSRGR